MDNIIPINRLGKFFSQNDFNLSLDMGFEYSHGDLNMKLVLYPVDREKTVIDDVYGEVGKDQIVFKDPVELTAIIKVDASKNSTYDKGLIRYNEPGNLTFSVYIKHLEELNVEISYGDYIGYPETESKLRFYSVTNDGKVTSDNKHAMYGYIPYYRTIVCSYVQDSEFRGI